MVWPTSVAVVTAVIGGVQVKAAEASRAMALAMGLGVCSPPHGYSVRESCATQKHYITYIHHQNMFI